MASAAVVMEEALAATALGDAAIPVYCNVTAAAETNAAKLRKNAKGPETTPQILLDIYAHYCRCYCH